MDLDRFLNAKQIDSFIKSGFVKIPNAFSKDIADEARKILWQDMPGITKDPSTWKQPVIRLGEYAQKPFVEAVNTPVLHSAFDSLVGVGRWLPRYSLGSFPIRFPHPQPPGDDGWHIDAGFPGDNPADYFSWRINISSKGRALLMLFLFSDVTDEDAPTRIQVGSHLKVAQLLEPYGERGLSFMEVAQRLPTHAEKVALASGEAGTVYLVHPFTVHASQAHHGKNPRFMAQPPLVLKEPLQLDKPNPDPAPIEAAIRYAIGKE